MDKKTFSAYSDKASTYSEDWLSQPEPSDMYELLQKYFIPKGTVADIGCGNGRDAHWLSRQGFRVTGFDASQELLNIGSKLFSDVSFKKALLPDLAEINYQYDNVLCETVIMHLPQEQIPVALENIKRIMRPEGILYLSWRVTENEDARHADGRLYSAFAPDFVLGHFDSNGVLHFEDKISASSGKRVCRLLYKK